MNTKRLMPALLALSMLLDVSLASCSGGRGAASLVPAAGEPADAAPSNAAPSNETVSVKIPRAPVTAGSARRRPAYVSPATASMNVVVAASPGATPLISEAIPLTATSPNCSATPNSILCTASFALSPGSYVASVTLYDGAVSGGKVTGNALSTAQNVPFTVVANQNNAIFMTLSGIPASVNVAPLPGQAWVSGNVASGFTLPAGKTTQFSAVALDADGDAIIGPGAPSISVTSTSSALALTQPTQVTPNTFSVTSAFTISATTASFSVTATPAGGMPLSTTVALSRSAAQNLYITNWAGTAFGPGPYVAEFSPGTSTTTALYEGVIPNVAAVDSNGNLVAAHIVVGSSSGSSSTNLTEWEPNGTPTALPSPEPPGIAPFATPDVAPDKNMSALATDSSGNIYVADNGSVSQYRLGSATPLRTVSGWASGANPQALAVDGGGDLVGIDANGLVQEYASGSTTPTRTFMMSSVTGVTVSSTYYQIPLAFGDHYPQPQVIAADTSGDLYVSAGNTGFGLTCNTPTGSEIAEFPSGSSTIASRVLNVPAALNPCWISAITTDSNGDLWVAALNAQSGGSSLGTSSTIVEFGPSGTAPLESYVLDGLVWNLLVDRSGDQYASTLYDTPTSGTTLQPSLYELLPGTTVPTTTLTFTNDISASLALGQ
jgi:antitoxin (DNA-binding transcriptional repressor) of toxin-antitoxin stability system